jgi:hypothetical protein
MRWMVEKVVHDPEKPAAPKPELPDDIREHLMAQFREDAPAIQEFAGRQFPRWKEYA